MTVPAAEDFDEWYEAIVDSPGWDPFVRQALNLSAEVESTGYLSGPGLTEVQRLLDLQAGELLLELGCGRAGYGLASIASTDAHLIGVDFSPTALRAADAASARLGLTDRTRFVVADLADTALPSASADAILCIDAFHFASSISATAREVIRLLKPGGRLVITTWEAADPDAARRLPERIARLHIEQELRAAGFVEVQTLERPDWASTETELWTVAAQLDALDDPALAGLREEAREFLPLTGALRRLLVIARR